MRKFSLILLATLFANLLSFAANKDKDYTHTILTANVRITGLEADEKPGLRWSERRDACIEAVKREKPDIVCTQEMIYDSYAYFKEKLKEYAAFGFEGPEMDPYTEGYHLIGKNVIFYNKKRYELLGGGCYWLSDEPLKGGSMSWGTNRARHCNYVRLRDRKTNKQIRVLNVHLDHISDEARGKQMEMIVEECAQYAQDFPQVMCGDFNSGIKDLPSLVLRKAGWKEMWETMNGQREYGFTAHAFKGDKYKPKKAARRIDFIYYHGDVKPTYTRVIDEKVYGVYPSDHYFLVAKYILPNK